MNNDHDKDEPVELLQTFMWEEWFVALQFDKNKNYGVVEVIRKREQRAKCMSLYRNGDSGWPAIF